MKEEFTYVYYQELKGAVRRMFALRRCDYKTALAKAKRHIREDAPELAGKGKWVVTDRSVCDSRVVIGDLPRVTIARDGREFCVHFIGLGDRRAA